MHLIPLAPLLALAVAVTPEAQEPRTDTYSIESLLIGQDRGIRLIGLPRYSEWQMLDGEVTDRDGLGRVVAGDVQDTFFKLLDLFPELTSDETFVTLRGNEQLVVRGSETWHRHVATLRGELERIVGHRTRVNVTVASGAAGAFDGLPEGTRVPIDALDSLLASTGEVEIETYTVDLRPGATGLVDLSNQHEVIHDYDVEIATSSGVMDPIVLGARTGTRIAARFVPRGEGGRLALVMDRSERVGDPVRKQVEMSLFIANVPEQGGGEEIRLELPFDHDEMLTRGLALDHDLRPGEVLLSRLGWDLGLDSGEELIGISIEQAPLKAVEVLRIGTRALVFVNREAIEGSYVFGHRQDSSLLKSHAYWNSDKSLELTIARAQPNLEFALLPRASTSWGTLGGWLVAGVDSIERADRIAAAIEPLLIDQDPGVRLRATATLDEERIGLVEVPSPIEGQAFGFVALTTPRFFDIDVEVATSSLAGDPFINDLETGLAVGLRPRRGSAGETVAVRTDALAITGEPRVTTLPRVPGGVTEHYPTLGLHLDQFVDPDSLITNQGLSLLIEWL